MAMNRKTYLSFEDARNLEYAEQELYTDYSSVSDTKEPKKRLIAAVIGVAALSVTFSPSPISKPDTGRNYIACVADIIEQAEKETSPQFLCETIDLYMHKPLWLSAYKQPFGGNDIDDEVNYNLLPIKEYEIGMQLGAIEKGLPPVFSGWEDELEEVVYHV